MRTETTTVTSTTVTPTSLVELLDIRAQHDGDDRPAYTFLADGIPQEPIGYRQLRHAALRVAAAITRRGAGPGSRVVLAYPPSPDFVIAFFGCLYAGAIAVPVYPPVPPNIRAGVRHFESVLENSGARMILTNRRYADICAAIPELNNLTTLADWVITTDEPEPDAGAWPIAHPTADTPAFIQYTSGSTALPKGVVVSHGNLLANMSAIRDVAELTTADVCVSWLPMYHDMGLIGCILTPLFVGFPCYLMSPLDFIRRPVGWLRAIGSFGGTVTAAPSFGYDLCVKRIGGRDLSELDLSSWRVAFNGAEPVKASTVHRFVEKFTSTGFRAEAFLPCYGLAEASLIVTGTPGASAPMIRWIDRARLSEGVATVVDRGDPDATEVVSSGPPISGAEVVIVEQDGSRAVPDGRVGEIWVRGPSVARGYWGDEPASSAAFAATLDGRGGGFLRTGDLGFLADGELHVTGRIKDLVIIRGRNIYPQDIELAGQEAHPRLRLGCGVAFTVGTTGDDRLVLVQETSSVDPRELDELITIIRHEVYATAQVQLDVVALTRPSVLPKTSSGKLQRSRCRSAFLAGELRVIAEWRAPTLAAIDE
jgi:acyl-CoA synthetase (AMP-forming)/AMP-acid ligase II